MENNTVIHETEAAQIERMRREMKELKESLSSQKIYTDTAMRRVMMKKSSWIKNLLNIEAVIVLPFCAVMFLGIKEFVGTSWLFYIMSMIFFVIDVIWDFRINRLKPGKFMTLPLVELEEKIVRQQTMRRTQMLVEVPLTVLWMVWFTWELMTHSTGMYSHMPGWMWIPIVAIGSPLGFLAAYLIYSKMQNIDRSIIAEIRELKNI